MQESKLLRVADKQAGSLLCWVLSVLRSWQGKSQGPLSTKAPKILLVELFEMGAAIMLLPSIKKIREEYPQAEIHCLTTNSCSAIWKISGAIDGDKIHVIDGKSALHFIFSFLQQTLSLRKFRFDLVIDYELFMRISVICVGLLKTKVRAGFHRYNFEGLYRGSFYNYPCAYNQNTHISKNFLALTKTALHGATDIPNLKHVNRKEEIAIAPIWKKNPHAPVFTKLPFLRSGDKYFLVCPDVGPTLAMRNYPLESLAKVIDALAVKYPSHKILLIGTEENRVHSERLLTLVQQKNQCFDLCGKTNFQELMDVIANTELLITNDNGPGHFATLTGTKALALFSTDSPFVYGPLGEAVIAYSYYHCSPCISAYNHKKSSCDNNKCLQALEPSFVTDLAVKILEGKANFQTINNTIPYIF